MFAFFVERKKLTGGTEIQKVLNCEGTTLVKALRGLVALCSTMFWEDRHNLIFHGT